MMNERYRLVRYTLPAVVAGFLVGVALGAFFSVGVYVAILAVLVSLGLSLVYWMRPKAIVLLCCIGCIACAGGLLRYQHAVQVKPDPALAVHTEDDMTLSGVVTAEVSDREQYQRVVISPNHLGDGTPIKKESRVLVYAPHFPDITYGDTITASGELIQPKSFQTDTGREFPYPQYLKKDDIFFQMFYPEISVESSGSGNTIKRNLLSLKRSFLASIKRVVPEPQAALLGGITVGAEEALGEKLQQQFRTTGLIHIVVLSGFNVTIVAEAIMRLLSFVSVAVRGFFGAGAIVLFALLTGASATIVRASIMAILVIIARAIGRKYQITRALFLAAALMVLVNPLILRFGPSFQLSFLASLGLIYIGPLVDSALSVIPRVFQLREYATATVATQLFVTPLLVFMTGTVSLVSLPVNLLSLPAIPISMLFGLLVSIAGIFSTSFAQLFALPAWGLSEYVFVIVEFFARLPFASVEIPTISGWMLVVIYILMGVFIYLFHRRQHHIQPQFDENDV